MDRHKEILMDLFEDVPAAIIDQLYDHGQVNVYSARSYICRQGDLASTMYILLEGSVGIYADIDNKNVEIDIIRHGTFGEISFLLKNYSTRSAHVRCHEDTTVLEISGRDFRHIIQENPSLGFAVTRIVLQRLMSQYARKTVEFDEPIAQPDSMGFFQSVGTQDSWSMTSIINTLFDQAPERVRMQFYSRFSNFREPKTGPQYISDVFVVMPFKEEFDHIYDVIKETVKELGLSVTRGDFFSSGHLIMTDVWSALYNARSVICDCTSQNPNVFYELGIAHTIGKKVILITQDENDVPFDVRSYRYITYYNTPSNMGSFKIDIIEAIKRILND